MKLVLVLLLFAVVSLDAQNKKPMKSLKLSKQLVEKIKAIPVAQVKGSDYTSARINSALSKKIPKATFVKDEIYQIKAHPKYLYFKRTYKIDEPDDCCPDASGNFIYIPDDSMSQTTLRRIAS